MPLSPPPPVSDLPPYPSPNDIEHFDELADDFVAAQQPFGAQLSALGANVFSNAQLVYSYAQSAIAAAADAASSAIAAAASSAASRWAAGSYGDGDVAWDPVNYLPYRHIGVGASATRPALDSAHWAIQLFALGLGGQLLSGNIALTSVSPASITVTPTGPGFYAYLADATTCQKGLALVGIHNAGEFDYGIKDYAGNVIGWIRAGATSYFGLSDNSTAAGVWAPTNVQKIGVTAILEVPSISVAGAGLLKRVAIDANRTFFLFGTVYGVIYDASSNTWGPPALIRSGSLIFWSAILSGASQLLVTTMDNSVFMETVTITISGSPAVNLTVNSGTKAATTLSGTPQDWSPLIQIGTSFVQSYYYANVAAMRAITISGATPAVGAEKVVFSGTPTFGMAPVMFSGGGSIVRTFYQDASSVNCKPYTVSGTGFTDGTGANIPFTPSATTLALRFLQNGNGNLIAQISTAAGNNVLAVLKLTGTTEAESHAVMSPTTTADITLSDYVHISASKTAFIFGQVSATNYINILTDTAGTASLGTALPCAASGATPSGFCALALSGAIARFGYGDSGASYQLVVDCSGSSPVLLSSRAFKKSIALPSSPSDRRGVRHFTQMQAANTAYGLAQSGGSSSSNGVFSPTSVRAAAALPDAFVAGVGGAAANEAWGLEQLGALGTSIKRIEAAA